MAKLGSDDESSRLDFLTDSTIGLLQHHAYHFCNQEQTANPIKVA